MNYDHLYHAGNLADVVKHLVLCAGIAAAKEDIGFAKQGSNLTVIDAFAGRGIYDLGSVEAQKTQEYKAGAEKLLRFSHEYAPKLVLKIIEIINNLGKGKYPGSPYFIKNLIDKSDNAIFIELHNKFYKILEGNFKPSQNIKLYNRDPFKENSQSYKNAISHLIALIDPPFEKDGEFDRVVATLRDSLINKNCMNIIWYPIKDYRAVKLFYSEMKKLDIDLLKIEISGNISDNLNSNGIIISNPCKNLDKIIEESLNYLKNIVYEGNFEYIISSLK